MEKELLNTIDFASTKGDRFLFVGLLLIGIIAASIIFKYLTSRLDRVEKKMDQVQTDFNSHLRTANKEVLDVQTWQPPVGTIAKLASEVDFALIPQKPEEEQE
jgi:type II secretory pathway pseudopilin PulG